MRKMIYHNSFEIIPHFETMKDENQRPYPQKIFFFNLSFFKIIILMNLIFCFLISKTLCDAEYSRYVIELDEKKFYKAQKKVDYFFLYINHEKCNICEEIDSEYGDIAMKSRIQSLKIRFFEMKYLKNIDFFKSWDIRTLPQIYFFDNKRKIKHLIPLEYERKNYQRFFKKMTGKMEPADMDKPENLNNIHSSKINMILLFNKNRDEAYNLYQKQFVQFMRTSVLTNYDNFFFSNQKIFFDNFVSKTNTNLKFDEEHFYFLTGPIKNKTIKYLHDEEIVTNKKLKKDDFNVEFNFFRINIRDFSNMENQGSHLKSLFLKNKFNKYSSLTEQEFNDLTYFGKPTLIIFGSRETIKFEKEFHQQVYQIADKYSDSLRFLYSSYEDSATEYFYRILNFKYSDLPTFCIIEKANPKKNDFLKYKRDHVEMTIESLEKFILDYKEKKLKLYFVSQSKVDINEEFLRELNSTLNNTPTNHELNKKYVNLGNNIYRIYGYHFEEFLVDNLNRTVVILGCSQPMVFCDLALKKIYQIIKTFENHFDKIVFAETDPNYNEYVVRKIEEEKEIDEFNDYLNFVFGPLYPQLYIFPAIDDVENRRKNSTIKQLVLEKISQTFQYKGKYNFLDLIRFLGKNAKITPDTVNIDNDYLAYINVDDNIEFTADFDEEISEAIVKKELEKSKKGLESIKELLGDQDLRYLLDQVQNNDKKIEL